MTLAAILAAAPASAHHSFAGFYDRNRIVEIEGIVRTVSWRNPHGAMTIDVRDEAGNTVPWHIETGSISVLRVRGFDREFVRPGDRVRISGEASLRGSTGLYARNLLLPNGEEVLLSIGTMPRWTNSASGELLEARFDSSAAAAARREAKGIFRVWSTVFEDPDSFPLFKGGYPLTAAAVAKKTQWDASNAVLLGCDPKGMPSLMITPYPIQFVEQDGNVLIRFEEDDGERVIHMASDAQRPFEYPSLLGYSTGRWAGKTLVVETNGISAAYFDGDGTPQSTNIRLIERFTMNDAQDRLDYAVTIEDPDTFTASFELRRYWVWRPELTINDYDCVVSNG